MDVRAYNRAAWDQQVARGNPWTLPVSAEVIARARQGDWSVVLTETRPVPREWFPRLSGCRVLGLACGGGQQGPVLAAVGAAVTIFDNSPAQLAQDRAVAERDALSITTVEGDMRDLAVFADDSFDLVFHPVSNVFVPEVRPVWREAFRVLRPGGTLLAGFMNPDVYVFDNWERADGLIAEHPLPFDSRTLSEADRERMFGDSPLEFSHTSEDLIGGQLDAGFVLCGWYEDHDPGPLGRLMPCYYASRAVKPDAAGRVRA